MRTVEDVIARVRAEFVEMPGLRLTREQVQRLCGVEPLMCSAVLTALVDAKFLCANSDGTFARLTDGNVSRRRAAKAELSVEPRAKAS